MNELTIEDYAKVFSALSHPIRLKIACGLYTNQRCNVNTMSTRLGISQSLVSQHVKILKEAKVIEGKREGNVIWYSLSSEKAKEILACTHTDICG